MHLGFLQLSGNACSTFMSAKLERGPSSNLEYMYISWPPFYCSLLSILLSSSLTALLSLVLTSLLITDLDNHFVIHPALSTSSFPDLPQIKSAATPSIFRSLSTPISREYVVSPVSLCYIKLITYPKQQWPKGLNGFQSQMSGIQGVLFQQVLKAPQREQLSSMKPS